MFKEIVVAFDGSDHSEAALLMACDIATKYGARLHLVHAPELYDQAISMGAAAVVVPVSEETFQASGEVVIGKAKQLAQEQGQEFASVEILHGPPADSILSTANARHADLIVLGRRGMGQLKGVLLGSVSQKLASIAQCAVLTVK